MNRPLFATDVILFSIIKDKLKVLLVKRGNNERECGKWALPGGIVDYTKKETSLIKAQKVLKDRLGITENIFLERCEIYDSIDRDPDEYSISVSYIALIDESRTKMIIGEGISNLKWESVTNNNKLAFDHNVILNDALEKVRRKLRRSSIGFKFLPKEFTIPQIRKIYESLLNITINPSNFRTKLLALNILEPCNKKKRFDCEGKNKLKGQPAKLYKLKEESFSKIIETEQLFKK